MKRKSGSKGEQKNTCVEVAQGNMWYIARNLAVSQLLLQCQRLFASAEPELAH